MKEITVFTDGACSQNKTWVGGWGVLLLNSDNTFKKYSGRIENTTNSRMEIQAVIEALKLLENDEYQITLVSDNLYVVNTVNEWLEKWIRDNSLPYKANRDLWEEYMVLSRKHKIIAIHVRGHSGNHYNEIVDKLATNAIKGVIVRDD